MTTGILLAALAAGAATALALPQPPEARRLTRSPVGARAGSAAGERGLAVTSEPESEEAGLGPGVRMLAGTSIGAVLWVLLGGLVGAGVGVAVAVWVTRATRQLGRGRERARAEQARADLPVLVGLFAAGLRAGAPAPAALDRACVALPGEASDRLGPVRARLHLGVSPVTVWTDLAADDVLGSLGRALARAHRTGAPVSTVVEDLSVELADRARAGVEDRARAVGVRAALPLGLCLLPGFLLLGIVPLVAALVGGLAW